MEAVVAPLAGVLELNTDLLLNCRAAVSDGARQTRGTATASR